MSDVRAAVTAWMNAQGIRSTEECSAADFATVRTLFSSDRPAFGIFLSFIMFERAQAAAQLVNADLSTSAGAVAAAKLQGIIQCVDNIRDLVLNLSDPIGEGSSSEDELIAGVRFDG